MCPLDILCIRLIVRLMTGFVMGQLRVQMGSDIVWSSQNAGVSQGKEQKASTDMSVSPSPVSAARPRRIQAWYLSGTLHIHTADPDRHAGLRCQFEIMFRKGVAPMLSLTWPY